MNSIQRQIQKALVLIGVIALLPACWSFDKKEAKKESLYVLNVLDKEDYNDCRIAGSKNVPFNDVKDFAKNLDKNTEIVVYCANYMCSSSGSAAQQLKELGFQNVWAYEGGTAEWYQLGLKEGGKYPVEGSCKAGYLSAPNDKPAHDENMTVPVISAQELHAKMVSHGLLAAQAPVQE